MTIVITGTVVHHLEDRCEFAEIYDDPGPHTILSALVPLEGRRVRVTIEEVSMI